MLETAVALFVFNRADTTRQVLDRLREVKPRRLFVVADGPRADRTGEDARCADVRALIETVVDWPCDIRRHYAERNLGCGRRVASGLDWVFAQEEEAIILEDDCVPDPTFFQFCTELLAYYRSEPRVGLISGDNFQRTAPSNGASYYFSAYTHIWGWATWRRSWARFDGTMSQWPRLRNSSWLRKTLASRPAAAYWRRQFDLTYAGKIDTWAYRWTYSLWAAGALTVLPGVNLVTNVGINADATHFSPGDLHLCRASVPMQFPLRHPDFRRDIPADRFTERHVFRIGWASMIKSFLRRSMSGKGGGR